MSLVERLRAFTLGDQLYHPLICTEAAAEIERLTAESERLLTENESLKLTLIELRANPSLRLADDAFQQGTPEES